MKKILFISIITFLNTCSLLAQSYLAKPIIDTSILDKWPKISSASITNDGRYCLYFINDRTKIPTMVVKAVQGAWEKHIPGIGGRNGLFSGDSRQLLFLKKDTLSLIKLGSDQRTFIAGVGSYQLLSHGDNQWLACQLKNPTQTLLVRSMTGSGEERFDAVKDYLFDKTEGKLLLNVRDSTSGNVVNILRLTNPATHGSSLIWSSADHPGLIVKSYSFDKDGRQLVFLTEEKRAGSIHNAIWYYVSGMPSPQLKVDDQSPSITPGLVVGNDQPSFSNNGHCIWFKLQPVPPHDKSSSSNLGVQVDVWSYRDSILQSTQLFNRSKSTSGLQATIPVTGNRVVQLLHEDETIISDLNSSNFVVVMDKFSISEKWWPVKYSYWQVSQLDGSRIPFPKDADIADWGSFTILPFGDWLVYYNARKRQYFSYGLYSHKLRNITKGIPNRLDDENHDGVGLAGSAGPLSGWLIDKQALLIYDNYDIWQVDPSGKQPPINVTNGYGHQHHIRLRLLGENQADATKEFDSHKPLELTAFNVKTKETGFYLKRLNEPGDPERLSMGNWFMTVKIRPTVTNTNQGPTWLVERESCGEAPNYFISTDLKTYRALTDLQPQKEYNWMTSELVSWKEPDRTPLQGILYKPENFDPHHKYPIIFYYYEQLSSELNKFQYPYYCNGAIDIPWFVSHGYIVFTPDIKYKIGFPGKSACNAVVSAAQYLIKKYPWIDAHKMGLQGHSFGGFETNYIVTHSHLFAAACAASGRSDLISSYNGLYHDWSAQGSAETGQWRLGATLWANSRLFFENSPVLQADKVSTPILLMNNKADYIVPFMQGVEFFTALRRLGKKAWMLQYDHGGHAVGGKDAMDFTLRISQFFDHYLKDAPASKWMTRGVPASLKQIETGLALDPEGWCGKDCPVCKKLHQQQNNTH